MCAYSLRKWTAHLTGHDTEDDRSAFRPFEQLERELALHALPVTRAPRLVNDVEQRESEAA